MKTVEVIINPDGSIKIDALGFKGSDCEKATAELEKALGAVSKKSRKPEYFQQTKQQAKVGL